MVRTAFVLVACVLLLAACGSSRHGSIPRSVAERLAAESDAVAARVRAGDGCGAAALARRLQQDVRAAGLSAAVQASADGLAAEIVCVPAPPPPVDVGHGKGKHKKHGKGHGD